MFGIREDRGGQALAQILKTAKDKPNFSDLLAQALGKFYIKYLLLPPYAAVIFPLWTMVSYVFQQWSWCSYLSIQSPEPGCGKSNAGRLLGWLCFKGTPPLYGTMAYIRDYLGENFPCTIIIDEWDSLPKEMRELYSGILNSGTQADGTYGYKTRNSYVQMPTFGPKVIVGRATVALSGPVATRCIPIVMHKAKAGEVEEMAGRHEQVKEEAAPLDEYLLYWAEEFRARRVMVHPAMPAALTDPRWCDMSRPLLAVADYCGGQWPVKAREALVQIFNDPREPVPENELLRLVQRYQKTLPDGTSFFETAAFCDWANKQYDRPWPEKTLTWAKVGVVLKAYRIFPDHTRRGNKTLRGYWFAQFRSVFERYL